MQQHILNTKHIILTSWSNRSKTKCTIFMELKGKLNFLFIIKTRKINLGVTKTSSVLTNQA